MAQVDFQGIDHKMKRIISKLQTAFNRTKTPKTHNPAPNDTVVSSEDSIKGLPVLIEPCLKGDLDKVKYWLSKQADPNVKGLFLCFDQTPLAIAARHHHREIVLLLLQAGANAKLEIEPLCCYAAQYGDMEMLTWFLQGGADLHARNAMGVTPLFIAAEANHLAMVKQLLKIKADPNAQDPYGRTPLMKAVKHCNLEMVECLLEADAHPSKADRPNRMTPLSIAAEQGNLEIVKRLLKAGANPYIRDMDGRTPSIIAFENGYMEIVEYLRQAIAKDQDSHHLQPLSETTRVNGFKNTFFCPPNHSISHPNHLEGINQDQDPGRSFSRR